MKTIHFDCPHCNQPIETPRSMAGDGLICPTCGKSLVVPASQSLPPHIVILGAVAVAVVLLLAFQHSYLPPTVSHAPPIVGVLGFNLGERLDEKYPLATNEETGTISYSPDMDSFTNMPPFRFLTVDVNTNRMICSISLYALGMEDYNAWGDLMDALTKKYGKADISEEGKVKNARFASGGHSLSARCDSDSIMLIYSDSALSSEEMSRAFAYRKSRGISKFGGL